ncbi:GOLPH3/VPS74 family protein [Amycolatopsis jiangsuensis]|uniref:Golgi phosphoprotein 3 GPP34 n=1 Tax=Amycolatopsis jiangsuensis TaxID=1181879 RepID=A0A840J0V6_9PSEU|nr:GPP34 family phosphoprotein [Amycolatopsis jiangsuensis]MBB4688731.1 hypothetical protein [Amycolatopsis jiangsuensis]
MPELTIAEEVVLIALDDEKGAGASRLGVDYAVAGACLVDLVLAQRITVGDDDVITVVQPTPTGTPHLDRTLEAITRGKNTKVAKALRRTRRSASRAAIAALVERGVLHQERARVLGVFPTHRYPQREGAAEAEVRARLAETVVKGQPADDRTAALIGLLYSGKLWRKAVPEGERGQVKAQMREISEGQNISPAVRQAIARTRGAIIAMASSGG